MSLANLFNKLDPKNDVHWTADGLPKLEILRLLSGNSRLTREEVVTADPTFCRARAGSPAPVAPPPPSTPSPEDVVALLATGVPVLALPQEPEVVCEVVAETSTCLHNAQVRLRALLQEQYNIGQSISKLQREIDAVLVAEQASAGSAHVGNQAAIVSYLESRAATLASQAAMIEKHGPFRMVPTTNVSDLDLALRRRHRK